MKMSVIIGANDASKLVDAGIWSMHIAGLIVSKTDINPPSHPQVLPSQQPGSEVFSSCLWLTQETLSACSSTRRGTEWQPESSQQPAMGEVGGGRKGGDPWEVGYAAGRLVDIEIPAWPLRARVWRLECWRPSSGLLTPYHLPSFLRLTDCLSKVQASSSPRKRAERPQNCCWMRPKCQGRRRPSFGVPTSRHKRRAGRGCRRERSSRTDHLQPAGVPTQR